MPKKIIIFDLDGTIINSSRSIIYAGDGSIKDIKLAAENFTNDIRKNL